MLTVYFQVYPASEWDDLMLRHVLPALATTLRDRFRINPRDQHLDALEKVLAWQPLLRSSMIDQLLEAEFFPKWLDALYTWLVSDPNYDEVTQWYASSFWTGCGYR